MRSGTRKVADSKPDAPIRKDSDTIPMSEIGKKVINDIKGGGFLVLLCLVILSLSA